MQKLAIGLGAIFVLGCGDSTNSLPADAAPVAPDVIALPDAAAEPGPPYSGTITAGGIFLDQGTIELSWSGGSFEVTTTSLGEFSTELPAANESYLVYIAAPDRYWSHSSWLLNVPPEGRTGLEYTLASENFVNGLSNVLGDPAISKELAMVSLDIRPGSLTTTGLGFSLGTASDPVFTFEGGVPLKTPTLLNDTVLIFSNVEAQELGLVVPNSAATGCAQLAPASRARANTILTLVVTCP